MAWMEANCTFLKVLAASLCGCQLLRFQNIFKEPVNVYSSKRFVVKTNFYASFYIMPQAIQ